MCCAYCSHGAPRQHHHQRSSLRRPAPQHQHQRSPQLSLRGGAGPPRQLERAVLASKLMPQRCWRRSCATAFWRRPVPGAAPPGRCHRSRPARIRFGAGFQPPFLLPWLASRLCSLCLIKCSCRSDSVTRERPLALRVHAAQTGTRVWAFWTGLELSSVVHHLAHHAKVQARTQHDAEPACHP